MHLTTELQIYEGTTDRVEERNSSLMTAAGLNTPLPMMERTERQINKEMKDSAPYTN